MWVWAAKIGHLVKQWRMFYLCSYRFEAVSPRAAARIFWPLSEYAIREGRMDLEGLIESHAALLIVAGDTLAKSGKHHEVRYR